MDAGIDPRLQQPFYTGSDYPFPAHPSTGPFDPSLHQYGLNALEQQQLKGSAAPVAASRSNVNNNQSSPQTRLRNRQQPTQLSGSGQSPSQQSSLPQRKNTSTPKQATGLVFKNSSSKFPSGGTTITTDSNPSLYVPLSTLQQSNINNPSNYFASSPTPQQPPVPDPPPLSAEPNSGANPFNPDLALVVTPPLLEEWRTRLFNIVQPLHLSESEFLNYFPHVDNIYSHRSTQKYKRKPFVSHYWDCRLKGRPSGTKKSDDPNKKKRKRGKRERDLCDVKIKITEWFGREECEAQGLPHPSDGGETPDMTTANTTSNNDGLQIVMDGNVQSDDPTFGLLEPAKRFPHGHPGADGKKWYTIQRVNPSGDDATNSASNNSNLDHKHTLEDSDRIKKNSVQRWQLQLEKSQRSTRKSTSTKNEPTLNSSSSRSYQSLPYFASGAAARTTTLHRQPVASHLTFFANAYCPFAQRVWIALEIKEIPYQYVEIVPSHVLSSSLTAAPNAPGSRPKELLDVNPEGIIPCIKHGNWGIWESGIMLEYLEDLEGYPPLLPTGPGSAQLRAHCRLWVDHMNRKILPAFYALLLTPPPSPAGSTGQALTPEGSPASDETHAVLISTLQKQITSLVNASHAIGPFFLGESISYADVAFAPWVIRLSRVLSYYRNFPRPEIGTRWQRWVEAVESDERVRRTTSENTSYHNVYRGVGEDGWDGREDTAGIHAGGALGNGVDVGSGLGVAGASQRMAGASAGQNGAEGERTGRLSKKVMVEAAYARKVLREEGFGLGGDLYGHMGLDPQGNAQGGVGGFQS